MSKLGYPHTHQQQASLTGSSLLADDDYSPVDTGLIQCICDSTEDDGFTIQCDRCLTWQHAYCMNINQNNIPDRYLCDDCLKRISSTTTTASRFIDDSESLDIQQQQRLAPRKYNKSQQLSTEIGPGGDLLRGSDSKSSTVPTTKQKENKTFKASLSSGKRSQSGKCNGPNKRSQRMTTPFDGDDSTASNSDGGSGSGNGESILKKPKLSKRTSIPKQPMQRHLISNASAQDVPPIQTTATAAAATGTPQYQPTSINTVKSKFVYQVIKETTGRWKQSTQWAAQQPWRRISSNPVYSKPSPQQQHSTCPFTIMDTISLQQSSSTRITIRSLPANQHHHSLFYQSSSLPTNLRKGTFADTRLHANTFLLEALGEMRLKSEYKFDPGNDYALLGTPCAHVLFYPTVDLCIDGRHLGNDARYFRRSCHPNAELRTMMVFPRRQRRTTTTAGTGDNDETASDSDDEDGRQQEYALLRLGVFTRTFIEQGEEITLGWNWQKGHISWRKNVEWCRSFRLDQSNGTLAHVKPLVGDGDGDEATKTVDAIQQMLERFTAEFGTCACRPNDVCLLERLEQESSSKANGGAVQLESISKTTHSRPLHVTTTTAATTTENGSMTSTYSSAAGSMEREEEENVDIDVISMPPSHTAPSPATSLEPFKKESHSDEDNGDGGGDIDVGVDLPVASHLPSENGDGNNFRRQASSSFSSVSSLSGMDSVDENRDEGIDDDSAGDRRILKKKRKYDGLLDDTQRSMIPCKKVWARHFLQHKVKTDDTTGTTPITDPTMHELLGKNSNCTLETRMDLGDGGTSSVGGGITETKNPGPAASVEKMDLGDDDGELNDTNSASTIPLDENDHGDLTSRRPRRHISPNTMDVAPTPASSADYTNNDDKGNKTFDTTSTNTITPSKQQDTTPAASNDPVKPTKVKVSLQEYLSRRMANHDPTLSPATSSGMAKPIP